MWIPLVTSMSGDIGAISELHSVWLGRVFGQLCEFESLLVEGFDLSDGMPADAPERVQLAEEGMHESLRSFPRAEDVLLVDARLSLLHAEQSLQLCLRDRLPLLPLDLVEHQEVLLRLELVLQAIEVDRFRAIFGLSYVQRAAEGLETGLCLQVFPAEVQLL